MNFRTEIKLPAPSFGISHSDRIFLVGSCFAENIGNRLIEGKFNCVVNPFGVLYNPLSIAEALTQIAEGKVYDADNRFVFQSGGLWHSWMHHSKFSCPDIDKFLSGINDSLRKGREQLERANVVIVTLGTARTYQHLEGGFVVGNCHKQPEKMFHRQLENVDTLTDALCRIVGCVRGLSPKAKVLFTVSPIRHLSDGLHENNISKASLLLALNNVLNDDSINDGCSYFPSYEILLDELRDYRFYADDMVHPSGLAVDYIFQRFSDAYFSPQTLSLMEDCRKIKSALAHRPFNPDSSVYRDFILSVKSKILSLTNKHPYLDFNDELMDCEKRLSSLDFE